MIQGYPKTSFSSLAVLLLLLLVVLSASAQEYDNIERAHNQPRSGNLRSSVTVNVEVGNNNNKEEEEEKPNRVTQLEQHSSTTAVSITVARPNDEEEEEPEEETESVAPPPREINQASSQGNSGNANAATGNSDDTPTPEDDGEVNILIIGSAIDMGIYARTYDPTAGAFVPGLTRDYLYAILADYYSRSATPDVKINVQFEERFRRYAFNEGYNTAQWFHWPHAFPDVNDTKENRWANLRNEGDTIWDYIILIGDSYTIERQPGLFTYGAGKIWEETQRTNTTDGRQKAELVLLQSYPKPDKEDEFMDHYREVIYRTGRSAHLKVAPAGIAWQEAGIPGDPRQHPSMDGSYISAASIFSRIWGTSASSPNNRAALNGLADLVYAVVEEQKGQPQYPDGPFQFQNAYTPWVFKDRNIIDGKTGGGSSTEEDIRFMGRLAAARTGMQTHLGNIHFPHWLVGRDSGGPDQNKDYRRNGFDKRVFGYYYQVEGSASEDSQHLTGITYYDFGVAHRMPFESETFRVIPRRLLFAAIQHTLPDEPAMGGHNHMWGSSSMACGTYILTLMTDRTPVTLPTINGTTHAFGSTNTAVTSKTMMETPSGEMFDNDSFHLYTINRIAYNTAWQLSHLQIRAPGLQALPSSENKLSLMPGEEEIMTVHFINPPYHNVEVEVSIDDTTIETLTFTPADFSVGQKVTIVAPQDKENGDVIRVHYVTKSEDEPYNGQWDHWDYEISS